VQVVAVGDAAFVAIPGELFVEFGLAIKRRSPFLYTYIAGLANGCVGYIPTRRAFAGGGYEIRLARSSKLVPEAGEQLTDTAVRLLEQVYEEG
jgi:neutral ceramidase